MKHTRKPPIATALLLLVGGAALLAIVEANVESWHDWQQNPLEHYTRVNGVAWSKEGRPYFVAYEEDTASKLTLSLSLEKVSLTDKDLCFPSIPIQRRESAYGRWSVTTPSFRPPEGHGAQTVVWWNGPAGQFDEYSLASRLRLRSLGPNGEVADAPARPKGKIALSFMRVPYDRNDPSADAFFYFTPDSVYHVTKPLRAVKIFDGPVEKIGEFWSAAENQEQYSGVPILLYAGRAVFIKKGSDPNQWTLVTIPLPAETRGKMVGFSHLTYGRVGMVIYRDQNENFPIIALRVDANGNVEERFDVDVRKAALALNGRPAPDLRTCIPTVLPPLPHKMTPSALIQAAALSALLAVIVAWRQSRRGERGWRRIAWPAFVLVTGLLGAGAYAVAHWDLRTEPCPRCARRRPVREESCPHCQAPWPAPARNNTEIVEPA